MKKKLLLLSCAIMALLMFVGCGSLSPSDTVKAYFEGVNAGTNSTFSKEAIKSQLGTSGTTSKIPDSCVDAMIDAISKMEVTTVSEEINGSTATVSVKVKGANLYKIIEECVAEATSSVTADTTQDQIVEKYWQLVSEKLQNCDLEERDAKINLTKSDDDWKVTENDSDYSAAIWGAKTTSATK